jgi:hypothetical protein
MARRGSRILTVCGRGRFERAWSLPQPRPDRAGTRGFPGFGSQCTGDARIPSGTQPQLVISSALVGASASSDSEAFEKPPGQGCCLRQLKKRVISRGPHVRRVPLAVEEDVNGGSRRRTPLQSADCSGDCEALRVRDRGGGASEARPGWSRGRRPWSRSSRPLRGRDTKSTDCKG